MKEQSNRTFPSNIEKNLTLVEETKNKLEIEKELEKINDEIEKIIQESTL